MGSRWTETFFGANDLDLGGSPQKGVCELELGILKQIQKDLGMDKRKDNKRKAPPAASFTSGDEPLIPDCCESDNEFFDNKDLPKKKLTPFSGKYRAVGKQKQEDPTENRTTTTLLMLRCKLLQELPKLLQELLLPVGEQ
jgi:hypothetical protein